jgi:hypothetical protein
MARLNGSCREGKRIATPRRSHPWALYAHDVIPVYPENHAVRCITNRMTSPLSMAIERLDIPTCAPMRGATCYREVGESPIGGIPDPDFCWPATPSVLRSPNGSRSSLDDITSSVSSSIRLSYPEPRRGRISSDMLKTSYMR